MNFKFDDYEEFKNNSDSIIVPKLSNDFLKKVSFDINPSPYFVFVKILSIHVLSALITLSVCPQFGIRFFGEGPGLMGVFMSLGDAGCLMACGSFFIGVSTLVSGFFLTRSEMRVFRNTGPLQLIALVTLSLGALIMLDADLFFEWIILAWVFGCFFGGLSMIEFCGYLKNRKFVLIS